MFTSFSEFKYFQSFRLPVESNDDVRFSVEYENDMGKMQFIEDGQLVDVSITGLGFKTKEQISVGKNLRFSIHFKRLRFDLDGKVVRAITANLGDEHILYGTEVEVEDHIHLKRFMEHYIKGFNPDRSQECLLDLSLTERYASAAQGFEIFSLLLSLFKDITQFGNMEGFVETMLEEIVRILNAQRASIFLINPDTNELEAIAALGIDKEVLKFDYRKGIAGSVFTTGVALNIDCTTDKVRFSEDMDKVTGFMTKSIICYPITNREDKVIGVIEILNKRNQARFTAEDEKTMKVLSLICSSVFHNYNPISEKSLIRRFSTPHDREFALVGKSAHVNEIRKAIVRLKDIDSPILIDGEFGTGKTLLARIIHHEGKRGLNPFHVVNCKGVDQKDLEMDIFGSHEIEGKLEKCIGGTVVFKDISYMPLALQKKLYEALISRRLPFTEKKLTIDVRPVFTSTTDLYQLANIEGSFNVDLWRFIESSKITVQPLRKRLDDVDDLISYFLKKECKKQGLLLKSFNEDVMNVFRTYEWPGNVCELDQAVSKAVLFNPKSHVIDDINTGVTPIIDISKSGYTSVSDIPYVDDVSLELKDRVILVERELILNEIKRHKGNKSQAAKSMGISREALRKKMHASDEVLLEIESKKGLGKQAA
jgi:two-component system response regulator HydG